MTVPNRPAQPRAGALLRRAGRALALVWATYPVGFAGSVLAALVGGLAPVAAALLLRAAIDDITEGAPLAQVMVSGVALAALGLLTAALPYLTDYLGGQLRRKLQMTTADQLFSAIADWPGLSRFENPEFYDRLRLGQQSGENAPRSLVTGGLIGGQALISLVGFLVTLVIINPLIAALVVVATLPAIPVNLALSLEQYDMEWWNSPGARRVQFFSMLLSDVVAAKEIRLFGTAGFLRGRLLRDLAAVNAAERAIEVRQVRRNLVLALLSAVVAGGALAWAVVQASRGTLTVGDLTALVVAVGGIQAAMGAVVLQYAQLHQFMLSFGHYLDVTSLPPDIPITTGPVSLPDLSTGIVVQDVWFRYDSRLPWVLKGVSLTIPHGSAVGLVGLNGAGKSTLVKLLCRFYDPERGRITWDGTDLRDCDPTDLRNRITAVFQDAVGYELTVAENVALGDLTALEDPARIDRALEATGLQRMVEELPRGRDTLLSRVYAAEPDSDGPDVGVTLSGGQWQRLALARAGIREGRDLMILDEPTTGLDPQAEQEVIADLRGRRTGVTSLVISHRMGTIAQLDHIVVLDAGEVIEQGSPNELKRGGVFASLFSMQAQDYQDPDSLARSDVSTGSARQATRDLPAEIETDQTGR